MKKSVRIFTAILAVSSVGLASPNRCHNKIGNKALQLAGKSSEVGCTVAVSANPTGEGFGITGEADIRCTDPSGRSHVIEVLRYTYQLLPGNSCTIVSMEQSLVTLPNL